MKMIQVNFLYEKLLVIDEQSFAKKILILCLICFIYSSLQSFLHIRAMAIFKIKYIWQHTQLFWIHLLNCFN